MGQDSSADGAPRSGQDAQAQSSRESFSATGMFEAVVPEAMPDLPAASAPVPVPVTPLPVVPVAALSVPQLSPAPFNPGMPVVHEVVFPAQGGASSSDPSSLLSSLRTLASDERVRAAELPPATAVQLRESVPPPAAPEAGFTQLLRSLGDTPAPSLVVPPQPSPVPPPGRSPSALSFTKLMRALDAGSAASSGTTAPTPEESSAVSLDSLPEASANPSQSTRVMPQVVPVEASAPVVPTSAPSSGSFTQLFQALDQQVAPAPVPSSPAVSPAAVSAAGSFTSLFRTAGPGSETPVGAAAEVPSAPKQETPQSTPPGSFTQMFQAVDAGSEPMATAKQATNPSTAGSFTELFRAIDPPSAPSPESLPTPLPPAIEAPPTTPVASSNASFTQIFQSLDSPGTPTAEPARLNPTPASTPPPSSTSHSGGSFTELFRAIDPATVAPATPPLAQKPYTPSAPPAASQSPGSFTQMFAAPSTTPASGASRDWGQTPQAEDKFAAPQYRSTTPPPTDLPRPDSGSLTQMLRTLEQPDSEPKRSSAASPAPPGAFTSIYAAREPIASQPERLSTPPAASSAGYGGTAQTPPPESGPSDFTRILQASSMREQALQRGEQAVTSAPQTPPAAASPTPPQMSAFPGQIPQFPHPSALPPVNFGVAAVPPAAQTVKGMPTLTPPPWMQPPAPPVPAAPPVNKTQQLLPIILIGIIFLLVIVLVAVVFLMKR